MYDCVSTNQPSYQQLPLSEFHSRIRRLENQYKSCTLCGHACNVDRQADESGRCGADITVNVASYAPHHGEERPIRGIHGSGTIFISHCNLSCVFCQNPAISRGERGSPVSPAEIAEMALELQEQDCHNINFVTPTHHTPALVKSIRIARERGLSIPIVWNCSGYERLETLRLLDGIVDIYMPDIKWADDTASRRYSDAPDYWKLASTGLTEMHRQVGTLTIDDRGIATSGVLVRHLVMPNHIEQTKQILKYIANEVSPETYVNLMSQYRPQHRVLQGSAYEQINRSISAEEYQRAIEYAEQCGLSRVNADH